MIIQTKNPESTWAALDINDNVISEGKTPREALQPTKGKTGNFFLMWMGAAGISHVFAIQPV